MRLRNDDRRSTGAVVDPFNQIPRYSASPWGRLPLRKRRPNRRERYLRQLQAYRRQLADAKGADNVPVGWLLPARRDLRRLLADGAAPTVYRLLFQGEPQLRPYCVALLSRMANRFQLCGIHQFRHDPSPDVRKQVAKALRRLEAWRWLEEMARANVTDRRVQWYAGAARSRPLFSVRLRRFLEQQDGSRAGSAALANRMPLWQKEKRWYVTPPKNPSYIRRLLLRIRRWVHGQEPDDTRILH